MIGDGGVPESFLSLEGGLVGELSLVSSEDIESCDTMFAVSRTGVYKPTPHLPALWIGCISSGLRLGGQGGRRGLGGTRRDGAV